MMAGGRAAIGPGSTRQSRPGAEAWRRVQDVLVAMVALTCSAPILAAAAILILAEDGGPVIYRRRVLARGGTEFDAFKLRTMRRSAQADLAADSALALEYQRTLKLKQDPRVTTVGRHLRRFSIDELPQLVNILRGQMTLVGPRMVWPGELHRFGDLGPRILTVKPGLTGLWQVSGRQDLDFEARLRLDREYLERRSLRLDLAILLRTIPVVLLGRGAY